MNENLVHGLVTHDIIKMEMNVNLTDEVVDEDHLEVDTLMMLKK